MPELDVREKVKLLPHQPGVYQFLDFSGRIIYIGKAKDLRNRVSSYFNKQKFETGKTAKLVANITDVNIIVVATEFDALLLENSLIKQHQPRYNVMLKDDKSYPWIRIRNERFPRVEGMRNPEDDGSEYYGPYASSRVMHTVVELVNRMYKLRSCNYELSERNVERGKYKRCLEFHLGNCKAPCEGLQSVEEYDAHIKQIRQIVRGRTRGVANLLKEQMAAQAEARGRFARLLSFNGRSRGAARTDRRGGGPSHLLLQLGRTRMDPGNPGIRTRLGRAHSALHRHGAQDHCSIHRVARYPGPGRLSFGLLRPFLQRAHAINELLEVPEVDVALAVLLHLEGR